MAIKSQIRLVQVTGSVVDFKPATIAGGVVAAAFGAEDMSGSLQYFAQALSNIHGNVEYGAQAPGLINAADGNNYDLHFRQQDTGQKIHIQSLGTGAQAVDIDSAGAVDVDASGKVQLLGGDDSDFLIADTKTLFLGEGVDNAQHTMISITHNAGAVTNEKILVQNNAGTTGDAIRLKAAAGGIWIDADSANADAINIDSAGGIDVDSATAMNFTTSDAAGDITFATAHTAGVAFHIDADANAGSIVDIDAGILDIDVTAAANIDSVGFDLNAGSGVIELTTTGNADMNFNALALDMTDSSAITITSSEAAEDLVIQQVGGNDSSIIIAAAGTGADAIKLGASAGGVDIDGATTVDVAAGTGMALTAADGDLTVTADGADNKVVIKGDHTGGTAIHLDANENAASVIDVDFGVFDADGVTFAVDTTGAINLNAAGVASGFTLTAAGANQDLTIAQDGSQDASVILSSAGTGVDAISLQASAGGIAIGVVDGHGVTIGKAGGVELMLTPHGTPAQEVALLENSGGTKRDAVKIAAAAGGLVMSASSALDLSGSVVFSADQGMDPLNGGSMPFAKRLEFGTFRGKSIFDRSTTVIGALNTLADSVASSEPTLFGLTLNANIAPGNDVTVAKVAGDGASLSKTTTENKVRVYVNGQLMKSSSGGVTNDYLVNDTNDLRFQFPLKVGDVVQVMDFS
jgi:hypothetical protein